jgi:uncharacterized protein YndB with AHSA1/START domain
MHVRSDRRHRFDVDRDELWAAMTAVREFPAWWPWLRTFDGEHLAAGERWDCTVQPPLPYALHFELAIDEVVTGELVTATISGDLEGSARLEVRDLPNVEDRRSEIRLRSDLTPTNRVLRTFAAVAKPVVRFGHDWVLDTGVQQFRSRGLSGGRATDGP